MDDILNMDIAETASIMAQDKIATAVNTAVLAKSLDSSRMQGQALLKLLSSGSPLAEGSGTKVDTWA